MTEKNGPKYGVEEKKNKLSEMREAAQHERGHETFDKLADHLLELAASRN